MRRRKRKRLVSFTGGASVGEIQGTFPFATLFVSANQLTLHFFFDTYKFYPDRVASLEIDSGAIRINHTVSEYPSEILFATVSSSLEVLDRIQRLGFLPSASPINIVRREDSPIRPLAGFIGGCIFTLLWLKDTNLLTLIITEQFLNYRPNLLYFGLCILLFCFSPVVRNRKEGKINWYALVFPGILLWIFLFLADTGLLRAYKPGLFSLFALFLVFIISVLIRYSPFLQWLIIKPGRNVQEVASQFSLSTATSGLLIIAISANNFGGNALSFFAFMISFLLIFLLPVARAYYLGGE